jgi:hypothetical protein
MLMTKTCSAAKGVPGRQRLVFSKQLKCQRRWRPVPSHVLDRLPNRHPAFMAGKAPFYWKNNFAGARVPLRALQDAFVRVQHDEQTGMALIC